MRLFLALLLVIGSLVRAPLASVKTEQPIVSHSKENNKQSQSARKVNNKPTPPVPVNGVMNQEGAKSSRDNNHNDLENRVYSVKVVSQPRDTLYLKYVIINAVIAGVGLGTLLAVWRQGGVMKQQLAAFIESQKPQIAADPHGNPGKDIFDPKGAHVVIDITNVGLTTAYNCTYESWIEIIKPPFIDFTGAVDHFASTNPFSLYSKHEAMAINIPVRKDILPHQVSAILKGDLEVCFRIKIEYRDAFTPCRYANFGYSIEGLGLRFLPKYNDSN